MAGQCINSNPDIAGIGTRINFYVTILLTAVLTPENEYTAELLDGLYKNATLYGLALVASTVTQTLQKQLDLYHAIFVMQTIFTLDFIYAYGQRRFIRSLRRNVDMEVFIVVQMTSTLVFIVWFLYVWIKDSKFGSQPGCNDLVKYVFLFTDVKTTERWLRVLLIIYLVQISCSLLLNCGAIFMGYLHKGIQKKLQDVIVPNIDARRAVQESVREGGTPERIIRVRLYFSVVPAVYGIATLELIVQRNRLIIQPGEEVWGFGQIIALVLISGSLIDIWISFRKWRERKAGRSAWGSRYGQLLP